MTDDNFSPEKGFELITKIISEAKNKLEEDGFIYVFWGALLAFAAFSQFALLQNGYYKINYYPYFLMPLGALYSAYYFSKKKRTKRSHLGKIISFSWIAVSLNTMILGFAFAPVLREHLVPILLILLSLGILISGVTIKSRLLVFSGVFINIVAYVCFNVEIIYHSLLMGIVAVVAVLIPGILLMSQYRKRRDVSES